MGWGSLFVVINTEAKAVPGGLLLRTVGAGS